PPMSQSTTDRAYQHLEPRPGSNYREWFLKGRRIRASVVDGWIHGPDPLNPKNAPATSTSRWKPSTRPLTTSPATGPWSSKSGTAKPRTSGPVAWTGPDDHEDPDRREYDQSPPGRSAPGGRVRRRAGCRHRTHVRLRPPRADLGSRPGSSRADPRP